MRNRVRFITLRMTLKISNACKRLIKGALAWQKSQSGNEDVSAVIGHKQADGSVVGMVSASQLEASFKQAADSSKSGQGQESIDELELTDYATGKSQRRASD